MDILNVQVSLNSFSARLDEDKNSRDESREIATDIMAATTTETNPFNSFDSLHSFCSCFINMHLAPSSLGAENHRPLSHPAPVPARSVCREGCNRNCQNGQWENVGVRIADAAPHSCAARLGRGGERTHRAGAGAGEGAGDSNQRRCEEVCQGERAKRASLVTIKKSAKRRASERAK